MFNSQLVLWLLFAYTIVSMVVSIVVILDHATMPYLRFRRTVDVLGYVCTIGIVLKVMFVGPEFIRWHLSDFGLPIILSLLFARIALFLMRHLYRVGDNAAVRKSVAEAGYLLVLTPLAVLASISYEVLVDYALRQGVQNVPYVGSFDWIDVACYISGGVTIWYVAFRYNRSVGELLRSYDEAQARVKGLQLERYQLEVRRRNLKT